MSDNPRWEIIQGDALKLLGGFSPGTFDAVITDPPYASGGRTQAEKNKSTAKKYSSMGDHAPPPFEGDAKDQRSWTRWAAEWLADARKLCKPGAPVCMFIDWRQLPAASDALQWAGWIWRGTAVWDKGNSRPQKGRLHCLILHVSSLLSPTVFPIISLYREESKEKFSPKGALQSTAVHSGSSSEAI